MRPAPRKNAAEIIDCTLSDGSHAVDHRFSARTIRTVLTGLEAAGVRFIELGHGHGLNAAEALGLPAEVSDEECFAIARESLDRAAWGMVCLPGVATAAHLRAAADAGMRFVRVGVDITEIERAAEYVELAKGLGLVTFTNLLKAPMLDTSGITTVVKQCVQYGADAVCLEDSAGGLLADDVAELCDQIRQSVDTALGFHAHDNMGMANANTLAAVNGGAAFVDTTLDGIGRGAGNASTETTAAVLRKIGAGLDYDFSGLARLSEREIRPLPRHRDDRSYELAGALTQTHPSHFALIRECAAELNVGEAELMAAVAKLDRVRPTREMVMDAGESLARG